MLGMHSNANCTYVLRPCFVVVQCVRIVAINIQPNQRGDFVCLSHQRSQPAQAGQQRTGEEQKGKTRNGEGRHHNTNPTAHGDTSQVNAAISFPKESSIILITIIRSDDAFQLILFIFWAIHGGSVRAQRLRNSSRKPLPDLNPTGSGFERHVQEVEHYGEQASL